MDAACELEAAVSKYLETLGLQQPEALFEATQRVCARFSIAQDMSADDLRRAIGLARTWAVGFCKQRDERGQAWLDVPRVLSKWPMTFACSDLPADEAQLDASWVTPARAALIVREQEIDVSFASLVDAANTTFQDAAFAVLQWARLRE